MNRSAMSESARAVVGDCSRWFYLKLKMDSPSTRSTIDEFATALQHGMNIPEDDRLCFEGWRIAAYSNFGE